MLGMPGSALQRPYCPCTAHERFASGFPGNPRSMKQCPFCAEDIQHAAVACKHCKRHLPGCGAAHHCPTEEEHEPHLWIGAAVFAVFGLFVLAFVASFINGAARGPLTEQQREATMQASQSQGADLTDVARNRQHRLRGRGGQLPDALRRSFGSSTQNLRRGPPASDSGRVAAVRVQGLSGQHQRPKTWHRPYETVRRGAVRWKGRLEWVTRRRIHVHADRPASETLRVPRTCIGGPPSWVLLIGDTVIDFQISDARACSRTRTSPRCSWVSTWRAGACIGGPRSSCSVRTLSIRASLSGSRRRSFPTSGIRKWARQHTMRSSCNASSRQLRRSKRRMRHPASQQTRSRKGAARHSGLRAGVRSKFIDGFKNRVVSTWRLLIVSSRTESFNSAPTAAPSCAQRKTVSRGGWWRELPVHEAGGHVFLGNRL